jgi:hypothetical protein
MGADSGTLVSLSALFYGAMFRTSFTKLVYASAHLAAAQRQFSFSPPRSRLAASLPMQ